MDNDSAIAVIAADLPVFLGLMMHGELLSEKDRARIRERGDGRTRTWAPKKFDGTEMIVILPEGSPASLAQALFSRGLSVPVPRRPRLCRTDA
jgi:hypothetical protein